MLILNNKCIPFIRRKSINTFYFVYFVYLYVILLFCLFLFIFVYYFNMVFHMSLI